MIQENSTGTMIHLEFCEILAIRSGHSTAGDTTTYNVTV